MGRRLRHRLQQVQVLDRAGSGALTKIKSALIIRSTGATDVLVAPKRPAFDSATNTITIPAITGVEYKIGSTVKAAGPVVIMNNTKVTASPTAGHFFENDAEDEWTGTRSRLPDRR